MPMPPLKGKTVAVPHPAVKPKVAAKKTVRPGAAKPPVAKAPVAGKETAAPVRPQRAKCAEVTPPAAPGEDESREPAEREPVYFEEKHEFELPQPEVANRDENTAAESGGWGTGSGRHPAASRAVRPERRASAG